MKNISFIVWLILICAACAKQEYESYKIEAPLNIVRVNLSPNSPVLIADGVAELKFIVKVFNAVEDTRLIEEEVDGEIRVVEKTFRDTVALLAEQVDTSQIKIYKKDGTPVGWTFRTTDLSENAVEFQASYQGLESTVRKVDLRPVPEDVFEPITVPVIFHVVVPESMAHAYTSIHAEDVQKLIDRANRVFKNDIIHAPSSIDSKITFELATHDSWGNELEEKGIHRVDVSDETIITSYIKTSLIWDTDRYLNIYISEFEDTQTSLPAYILDNGAQLDMEYIRKVSNVSNATFYYYYDVSIGITKSNFYSMVSNGFGLEDLLGKFYGLYPSFRGDSWGAKDDFCDDTYTSANVYMSLEKWTYQGTDENGRSIKNGNEIYYNSYNIMDAYSPANTITYDQVKRIRTVIDNCPFRMMRK